MHPLGDAVPMATVIRMASPVAHDPEPELVPPAADPEEIRACLSSQMRYEFDREWDFALEEAKRTHSLAGITTLLATWRLWAYTELNPEAPGRTGTLNPRESRSQTHRM